MILSVLTSVLFIVYSLLIFYYRKAWIDIPEFRPSGVKEAISISVIIPARNEEKNIGKILSALQDQSYPAQLFEVIVVDDCSNDQTAEIAEQFSHVKVIRSGEEKAGSHKKKAIEKGINSSRYDLIVTTDADCIPGKNWLLSIAAFKKDRGSVMIAGPVMYETDHSLFQVFQSLDFMTLQGITGASLSKKIHGMGNGANLAYEKKVFHEVNGFSGIDSVASGDDILLIEKVMSKYPGKVHYLKSTEAIVVTPPAKTWKEFLNQRIRWASKATYYKNVLIILILLMVYLFNLLFPALFIAGFWNQWFWWAIPVLLILKTLVEYPFIRSVSRFFREVSLLRYFFLLQPLHILYTLLAGFLGQTAKYEWKGRKIRN